MTSSNPKILLTGATGYIGGTVLSQLLSSPDTSKYGPITCLIRGEERQRILTNKYGDKVNPVIFQDLNEADRLIEVASQHDIIINTALGYHPTSSRNLVLGLSKRRNETGKDTWIIHTSGTSNLADQPISKNYAETREFSDKQDIYGFEKKRNAEQPYGQRSAELALIDAGLETGVKTLSIMSPIVYGTGTGEFNRITMVTPHLIRDTIKNGYAIQVSDGKGEYDHVHVTDLAKLYQLVLNKILLGGAGLPHGQQGIIFSEAGRHTLLEMYQGVADAVYKAGKIQSNELKILSIQEASQWLSMMKAFSVAGGVELFCELGFVSSSRTKADVARELGWKPEKGVEDWRAHYDEDLQAVLAEGV